MAEFVASFLVHPVGPMSIYVIPFGRKAYSVTKKIVATASKKIVAMATSLTPLKDRKSKFRSFVYSHGLPNLKIWRRSDLYRC